MQSSLELREAGRETVLQDTGGVADLIGDGGLRNGVHVLTSVLLVVALAASVQLPLPEAVINLGLNSLFAFTYFFGANWWEQWSHRLQLLWVALLTALWVIMLPATPVAIYLVFPLFFLYLQVMDDLRGIIAVVAATAMAILAQLQIGRAHV